MTPWKFRKASNGGNRFSRSPPLCLHDLDPARGRHSKVGKTNFWGVKNIDIWTGSKFATQIWEAVFYCDWWSLFRKSILLTFEPAQKVRVRMWPIVTPENDCNVAFQKQTNAAKRSIQKQTRIGLWIGLDTGFLPCCASIPKPTNTTFKNKLE